MLLAATAGVPAQQVQAASQPVDSNQSIIITAPPIFRDVQPERSLDPEAIDSYGLSTIDELLAELQVELGSDEDFPLIIVNGERLNSIDEIGALPVEALRDLVVLPRGSAVRAGGTANQRVISMTLKPLVRSVTLTAAEKLATEGDAQGERGEVILTSVKGQTRANLTVRGRRDNMLLESDRGIIQPAPRRPYALQGNIIGYPNTSGEIDPALSALAGEIVTVVPLPATNPALADLVAGANRPATTDIGDFRSLRPRSRNYDLNATYSRRLAPWLTANATLRLNRNPTLAIRGLPTGLFILSADNPASPFDRDVGIAVYGKDPLRYRGRRTSGDGNITLDANFGRWNANFNAHHNRSRNVSTSEREANFAAIPLNASFDPFGGDLSGLIPLRTNRAAAFSTDTDLDLTVNGPLVTIPAGDIMAVAEGRLTWDRLHSTSTFSVVDPDARFHRNEAAGRLSFDVPLTSRENNFLGAIGDLRADLEVGRIHYSDAGTLDHEAAGLTWDPISALQLRMSWDRTQTPPPIQTLGDPVIITPDVRVFDPLTGQTVSVTQIYGGNPDILPQTTVIKRLSALVRLVPKYNLQLNGEYTDTDRRDFISSLPDSSAAIMQAFPERFLRDSEGNLISVDLRPVNFDSEREKRFRWGFNMNTRLGATPPPPGPPKPGEKRVPPKPGTFIQLNANHTIVFSDKIVIRPGLPPVDLLHGGAIGIGGGRVRHQVDGTAGITSGGLGARLSFVWRGKSTLLSRLSGQPDTLRFSSLGLVNLRLFAEGKRLLPKEKWAKGLRVSLDVVNLFNKRQKVRDSSGETPLQYQAAYRDPIGRTVELELRMVF